MIAMLLNAAVSLTNGDTAGAVELALQAFGLGGLRHGIEKQELNPQRNLNL